MKIEVTLTVVENEAVEYTLTTGGDSWDDIRTIIDNAEEINLRKNKTKKKGKRLPGFIQKEKQ
jgi:hypothetical protein